MIRRGPLAQAVGFEIAREGLRQALAVQMAELVALEHRGSDAAALATLRDRVQALAARMRSLPSQDEAAIWNAVHASSALLENGPAR